MMAGINNEYPGTLVASRDRYLFETSGERAGSNSVWS
jgi:hypothetical protein